jgi:hypothetical protein
MRQPSSGSRWMTGEARNPCMPGVAARLQELIETGGRWP